MSEVNPNHQVSILVPPSDPQTAAPLRNTDQWRAFNGRTGVIQRSVVNEDPGFRVDLHQVFVKLDDDGSEAIVPHAFLYF